MARITIVSTGGTRAPSQLELADRFLADGHEVRCIATKNALRFLSSHIARRPKRLGFYARLYRPQLMETFAYYNEHPKSVPHVSEGKWADVVVMCPASCNSVGKLAAGMNDNYALLVLRAVPRNKRVIVVPSMNPEMWFDPQFQRNVDILNSTEKYRVICPSRGLMLSGDWGFGAQASIDDIVAETYLALGIVPDDAEAAFARCFTVPWEEEGPSEDGSEQEIALVDEDDTLREQLAAELLRKYDRLTVSQFRNPGQALTAFADHDPALVVTELSFSGGASPRDLIERFRKGERDNPVQIIAISAADRRSARAEDLARREVMYLPKPLNLEFTVGMIAGCLQGAQRATPVERLTLEAGDVLFSEGADDRTIYIVESGALRIVKHVDETDVELGVVGADGVLGELGFLQGTRTASAIAKEPTVVHAVHFEDVRELLARQPLWMRTLVDTLVQRVHDRDAQAVAAVSGSVDA
jgi:CheY-like chemotaxis protein/3-polyprenyl-4-hydroxybenzoate decarboxylase